jgi:hypothetical protein
MESFFKRIPFSDDFYNHKFLHQSAMSSPSKRILDQQRLSPTHIRRTPSADHTETLPSHPHVLHRVGSEQSHQIGNNIANNIRPATVTRALPTTYTTSPIRQRSENHPIIVRPGMSRTPSGPEAYEKPYYTQNEQPSPLRHQKSAPQAIDESGEFTFLPPLNQPAQPGATTPRSSRQNLSNENAVKQVQVHSSKTSAVSSRAVPVPSQRLAFAKMEQERQNAKTRTQPQTEQQQLQPAELNFEDMR